METDTTLPDPAGFSDAERFRAERRAPGRPRRNTSYELFVLGELMNAPQHGYLLREILNRVLGPFRQISWGVLYPLIHALEDEGCVAPEAEPEGPLTGSGAAIEANGRQRRAYRLTDTGYRRFHALMQEPSPYTTDYPELFLIKLNLFAYCTPEEQCAILNHHRAYLQSAADYLHREHVYVANRTTLPEQERPHILRQLAYRLSGVEAELGWIEAELARLPNGSPH